jgi:hypothetical protein
MGKWKADAAIFIEGRQGAEQFGTSVPEFDAVFRVMPRFPDGEFPQAQPANPAASAKIRLDYEH